MTALYFHNLCNRVPMIYDITVTKKYYGVLDNDPKVLLHKVDKELLNLGKMKIKSPQGQDIDVYDIERCLCDCLKDKNTIASEYIKEAFNIGDERRTTSDMDTMIKGIDIESDELLKIIQEIINIKTDDAISFEIENTKEIRVDDVYGGINIKLIAKKDGLIVPLFIDITTKNPITPREIEFKYKSIFDDEYIKIMAFNKETIIAEKFKTLIKDTETNTRAKDFYDLYVLIKEYWNELDKTNLIKAIRNTCKRRESLYILDELEERFDFIKESAILQGEWDKYQITHLYARDINYADIMKNINLIIKELAKEVATI